MELIQGSETSANYNLTPGKYPKEHIQLKQSVKIRRRGLFGDVAAYYVKLLVVFIRCPVQSETLGGGTHSIASAVT